MPSGSCETALRGKRTRCGKGTARWHLLRDNASYTDLGADWFVRRTDNNTRRCDRLINELPGIGLPRQPRQGSFLIISKETPHRTLVGQCPHQLVFWLDSSFDPPRGSKPSVSQFDSSPGPSQRLSAALLIASARPSVGVGPVTAGRYRRDLQQRLGARPSATYHA